MVFEEAGRKEHLEPFFFGIDNDRKRNNQTFGDMPFMAVHDVIQNDFTNTKLLWFGLMVTLGSVSGTY